MIKTLSSARPDPNIAKREDVLANLSYFTEWGGRSWESLCRSAIQNLGDLHGKKILEVGMRSGKMSACFGLLGAQVIGIEINSSALEQAEKEVMKWGISRNVTFFHYDGDIDHCAPLKDQEFDVIFTKSVLVLLGDPLVDNLKRLDRKLKRGGICVFLENSHGGPLFSLLRRIRPSSRGYNQRVSYLTPARLKLFAQVFDITVLKKSLVPPIYLIMAKKKCQANCAVLDR